LCELQEAELRIKGLKGDQESYPRKIKDLDEELTSKKETASRDRERLETLEKERRRKEGELSDEGERIKRTKGRLFEVKTNKEYQALLHEIEAMEHATSQKEDEILSILEEMDQLRASLSERENLLVTVERETHAEISEIEGKMVHLVEDIAAVERRREDIVRSLGGDLMKAYEALKARRGNALAAAIGGACQGCYVNIPPQMFNEVQRNDTLIRCPNCSRFLYSSNDSPSPSGRP
jgi:predicted  nucleic acid-binding Zn-ribbon protein